VFEAPSGIPAIATPDPSCPAPAPAFGPEELASWQRGEEAGCRTAWRVARGALERLARGLAGNAATAEELAHDAFARAHHARASLTDPTGLVPWMIAIAVRLARNVHRGARRRATAEAAAAKVARPSAPDPLETLDRDDRARATRAAIDGLALPLREVLVLRHLPLRAIDVAVLLGLPLGTVKSRHRAAIAALARALAPLVRDRPLTPDNALAHQATPVPRESP